MNRQMKRMQEKAERQGKRSGADRGTSAPATAARRAQTTEKKKRTGIRQFIKEVRQELKKVDWPNRRELVSYTVVVLATLIVTTLYIAGLDFVFSRAILDLLG
jgi:preprotein translocase subunit SecE